MTEKFETDRLTFDEINALLKPNRIREMVPLDPEALRRVEELESELRRAERRDGDGKESDETRRLRRELEEAQAEAANAAVEVEAVALPRKQWRELIEAHPPREDDPADKGMRWHTETFAPAAISACIVKPEGIDGQVVWDQWPTVPAEMLYGMAVMVNEQRSRIPFGARSSNGTRASERNSPTASR